MQSFGFQEQKLLPFKGGKTSIQELIVDVWQLMKC